MRSSLEQLGFPPEDAATSSNLEQFGPTPNDVSKNPVQEDEVHNQSGYREKRTSVRARKGKNAMTMRSPAESSRVLRSRSQEKSKAPEPINNLAEDTANQEKKRKRKEQVKNISVNEFLRIRRNLSYLLSRIKYEETLIDAYSGEGWKGQSLEKIKPEKELQRAKSEIFRRKLKIRDLFQRLHMLCAEERLPQSLFDSTGEIDSEDLYCAKCGSKEFPANKDIILCDGVCERGFHLFCLEPPILKEDLHLYEDSWLCPACDCKVDCTNLLNDLQGTDLSISDSWEKVFPEAAAAAAAGKSLDENFGFPSDDSEDDDYDPDGPVLDEKVQGDASSSDESDFSSSSEDLRALPNDEQYLGLPSDDSEDDDFNPNVQELNEQVKQESSSSDFTSDSEDFSVAFDDNRCSREVQESPTSDYIKCNGEGDSAPLYGKRHVERLDYKKLHDEEYGNASSDSSDEDYMDIAAPKKRNNNRGKVASVSPDRKTPTVTHVIDDVGTKQNSRESERTPKRRTSMKLDVEGTSSSPAKSHKGSSRPRADGNSTSKSTYKRLGDAVTQRLSESFKENQYPDQAVKEELAKELGITAQQVNKWFVNSRWSFRHPSTKKSKMAENTSNNGT